MYRSLLAAGALLLMSAAPAPYDPAPMLADLAEVRAAVDAKYANLDWLRSERGYDVDAAFARAAARIEAAPDDATARRSIERMLERFRDGHVAINWPAKPAASAGAAPPAAPAGPCATLGFDARQSTPGPSAALPGYRPLPGTSAFPAGLVTLAGTRVGVVRIGVFQPNGTPALCEAALDELHIRRDAPCDDDCTDRILTLVYARFTADFGARLRAVKAAGAEVLLVDLAGNGGGSEWAEAAARMVTAKRLVAAPLGFVRGPHWQKQHRELAAKLRAAADADPRNATRLRAWAAQADAAAREADRDCRNGSCPRIARSGFATGLVGSAAAGSFAGNDWGMLVFSPAQYEYRDGVWSGPLVVLVDDETWSAAEEFAATLQDNGAAIIAGTRTGGAGCGHTYGGTPTTLTRSGAILELPDCVRFRRDGSNEVSGIVPDVPIALRSSDGPALKTRLLVPGLEAAVQRATAK